MKEKLQSYFKAGYAGLYIVSYEGQRVEAEVAAVAKALSFKFYSWTATNGVALHNGTNLELLGQDPHQPPHYDALNKFTTLPKKSALLLCDMHMYLDPDPVFIRKLKDCLLLGKATNRVILILGCQLKLIPELEKEFTVIEFKLPDRDQLRVIAEGIAKSADLVLNGQTDKLLDAASGCTCIEAENAFALSVVETKDLTPDVVAREKAATLKKNGLLEIVESTVSLDDIGGLENLKKDLFTKRNLFTQEAKEYGLDTPRGLLVCGQAGTGKSLTAAATKSVFNLPLVRLEAGRIFGSMVGESERNWRTAFATVKAIAPCILWVDEVDGLFSGAGSSGKTDGGTTSRVIKAILQDMQFNGDGVFFVFTANDVDNLPDPLIDRLDVWSVDLPNHTERAAIWGIHIAKRNRKPAKFDLDELAAATDGFSGRQIEQVWLKAMVTAFNFKKEPTNSDAIAALKGVVPTSVLMAEQIEKRRARLLNRSQPASAKQEEKAVKGRKLVA